MDTPSAFQQDVLTNISGSSTLVFLLQRGADYLHQGHYIEAEGILALAREQLVSDQTHFAEVLDAFIQAKMNYYCIQKTLREIITRSVETWEELQNRASLLQKVLLVLIQDLEPLHFPAILIEDRKGPDTSSAQYLASQSQQDNSALTIPSLVEESTISLPELYITCFSRFRGQAFRKTAHALL